MNKREVIDINGRQLKVGDLVLLPKFSVLCRAYVVGFTAKAIVLSCFKNQDNFGKLYISRRGWRDISLHNARQNLQMIPDIYLVESDEPIPENIKKLIR